MQPLQYDLRDPAAQEISITHAAAVPSNLDAAVTMRFAASRCKPARIYARGNIRGRQSCSHANAICNHSFKKRIQLRTQEQPLVAKHIEGTNRVRNGPSRTRRTHEVPFIAACSHFTRKNARFRAPASSPKHGPCNIHAASPMRFATTASRNAKNYTHTGTTTRCNAHRRNQSRPERPQPHPPHTRGTFHRRLHPLYTEKYKVSCSGFLPQTWPMQHSCSQSNAICNHSFKKRIQLRTQEQPLVAKHIEGTNRVRNDPSRTRRTHEVPFIAACSHFTRKDARFRAPAPPQHIAHATFMQPVQCDLQPQFQETHRTTHTGTTTRCKTHRRNTFATETTPAFPSSPLPFVTTSLRHHFPSSPLPFITTSLRHHFPSSPLPFVNSSLRHHFPSSPLPFVTTSLRHHFPSSSLPFVTTSLPYHFPSSPLPHRHHFPSSPLPFVTISLHHHFPSSPLPFITTSLPHLPFLTTSLRHHFPSSPLPFVTTSLLHHFPASPIPFLTTSLRHHFPSSPLPFITTSLRHHFPSSPLPFVNSSHRHHFPSSPLPFVTTSFPHHFPSSPLPFLTTLCHSFLFFCYALLFVLFCDVPPFIKVNSIVSFSVVIYCYVM